MVRVEVEGVGLDASRGPVVVLREAGGQRVLPIWIGHSEASAIQMKLDGQDLGRPMTHDLIHNIMASLSAVLVRIEINALKDQTYYAELIVSSDAGELRIDGRPSDSVALALRFEAEILVEEALFRSEPSDTGEVQPEPQETESTEQKADRRRAELRRRLRDIDPGDFGSFKLGE